MRPILVLMALPFVLAMTAGALQAQCATCAPVIEQCAPCAVTQPVCPEPCPQPVTCCPPPVAPPCNMCPQVSTCDPCAMPAGIGAGPIVALQGTCGACFDTTYVSTMYQQNADISALAAYGVQHVQSGNLRWLSQKIVGERNDLNSKLAGWYPQLACGPIPCINSDRVNTIIGSLAGCCGCDFDRKYAVAMVQLMGQSVDANNLAVQRLTRADIRNQAQLEARTSTNEMNAFNSWLQTGHF